MMPYTHTLHTRLEPDLPLVTHVTGNLWMGGALRRHPLNDHFASVLSVRPSNYMQIDPRVHHLEVTFSDGPVVPHVQQLDAWTSWVQQRCQTGPTLVHCQMGLNRSGLIVTYALMRGGLAPGNRGDSMTAPDALALLRHRRHALVLCNEDFERWLLARVPQELVA